MANLRDIKSRISSVKTTRQVTGAMKMVSAARLKKAQDDISHIRPYTSRLVGIIQDLMATEKALSGDDWFTVEGKGDKVLVLAIASNRGLCGGFNQNVVKEVQSLIQGSLKEDYKAGKLILGVLGKQAEKMFTARKIAVDFTNHELINNPDFKTIAAFGDSMISAFKNGTYKRIFLVYNEFMNAAVQEIQSNQFLPMSFPVDEKNSLTNPDYIIEPNPAEIVRDLLPRMLHTLIFQVVLESAASEHGARMTSMHKATDNATELISELELSYNKARQAAITNQIVEITGGAEALKGG